MHHSVRSPLAFVAGALLALTACSKPPPAPPAKSAAPPAVDAGKEAAREKEVQEAAVDAYVYGYPLVTMELTRRVMTNVTKPAHDKLAPMGQLIKVRAFPAPADREVTAPDADALYTMAWLDVGAEPWVVSVPDMKGRYDLLSLLSGWSEVFESPGSRTTGTKAQKFAVTGPGWMGKLPAGVKELKSPTALVWLLGRINSTGTKQDLGQVHALQDRIAVFPLSASGKKYVAPMGRPDPAVDGKTPVRDQVNGMDAVAYFKLLASLLKTNPPAAADTEAVAALGKIGLVPGQDFDGGKLDSTALRVLAGAPKAAQAKIMGQAGKAGTTVNGWSVRVRGVGVYGTDYLQRAFAAAVGLGASRAQDAVSSTAEVDAEGKPLDGSRKYVLHFPKGQRPPAKAFWSLTMYDGHWFLSPNKQNRHTRTSRDRFHANKDGSVDLLIQKDAPGKVSEANWLPVPPGRFNLMLRLYWPQEKPPSILDGSWKPPAVTPVR
jgi:hypothetical protein